MDSNKEITQDMIDIEQTQFDGTCPFHLLGAECSLMSVEECNKCIKKETQNAFS